jgi:hypothetical protein
MTQSGRRPLQEGFLATAKFVMETIPFCLRWNLSAILPNLEAHDVRSLLVAHSRTSAGEPMPSYRLHPCAHGRAQATRATHHPQARSASSQ